MISAFSSHGQPGHRESGFVLILVLVSLALLTILVVSFLVGSSNEVTASASQLGAAKAQNLSASALNLAMRQVKTGANAESNERSWASQPGMIRQFVSGSTESEALYKLYSSERMVVSGNDAAAFLPGSDLDPNWQDQPAMFTDLNAPKERDGRLSFPIVDPRLDPADVDGFSYSADPGDGSSIGGVTVATDDTARLPMPVRWLYVLQDGRIEAGSSTDGKTVTVPNANANNPIIGRVAFWTDDDTCKVNINTASEGVYWDVPSSNLQSEFFFDESAPMRGEFQRFPGHPATVSLSAVFPNLKNVPSDSSRFPTEKSSYPVANNAFYRITPRIQQGGSYEGLFKIITQATINEATEIRPDAARLYDTVDELIFQPDRNLASEFNVEDLKQKRFFLTAQSRAPELTLFNTPRISVWPLSPEPNERESMEHLMAFSSSLPRGGGLAPFYFERATALSQTADFLLPRNQALFEYLQWSTEQVAPGFVGSLQSTWGADHDQILTEVFDYIRSGPNLQNRNNPANKGYTNSAASPSGSRAVVLPTYNAKDDARGFGRFPAISEISLVFGSKKDNATEFVDNNGGNVTTTVPCSQIWPAVVAQLFHVSNGHKPSDANVQLRVSGLDNLTWTYRDKDGVERTTALYPPGTVKTFRSESKFGNGGALTRSGMGIWGVALLYADFHRLQPFVPLGGNDPTGLSIITSDPSSIRFNGSSAPLTFELYAARESPSVTSSAIPNDPDSGVQTYSISFPAIPVLPRPWMAPNSSAGPLASPTDRINILNDVLVQGFIQKEDVVKSLVVRHGDHRLIAGKTRLTGGTNATDDFVPHQNYFVGNSLPNTGRVYYTSGYPRAHTLAIHRHRNLYSDYWTSQADLGRLHPGPYNDTRVMPYLASGYRLNTGSSPISLSPVSVGLGDYDTGPGCAADGSFINKPDEGPDLFLTGDGSTYRNSWIGMPGDPGQTLEKNFSPTRQMASPIMFGSLSSGVKRNLPWQTLLFNPNPAIGTDPTSHPGFGSATTPPDSLLLDLFWMPVAEPYAISDRLSTAGKINMNYQIAPFTHIQRSTGMYAALKNLQIPAIQDSLSSTYKRPETFPIPQSAGSMRHPINVSQTLKQFDARFSEGKIFRSPTEITSLFLIPEGQNWVSTPFSEATLRSNAATWWSTRRLTGDNLRERPYNALYPLLTTQSNVYTVHVKAEALKQRPESKASGSFTQGRDTVEASAESAFTIERYLNPEATTVSDDTIPLGSQYLLRVINRRDL